MTSTPFLHGKVRWIALGGFGFLLTFPLRADSGNLIVVPDKAPAAVEPFDQRDVQLLDGPFKQAQDLNLKLLLKTNLDLLLYPFRREAGLPSPVKGSDALGWPVTGHTLGHFLSASALLYRNTGDPDLHHLLWSERIPKQRLAID